MVYTLRQLKNMCKIAHEAGLGNRSYDEVYNAFNIYMQMCWYREFSPAILPDKDRQYDAYEQCVKAIAEIAIMYDLKTVII